MIKNLLFIFIFLLLNSTVLYAEDGVLTPYKKQTLFFMIENDFLAFRQSDRFYTNGARISYTSKEYNFFEEYNPMSWAKHVTITSYNKPHITRFHIGINQEMYTSTKHGYDPVPNDHPFGGFLYLNTGITNRTQNTLEHIGLKIGLVGEYSGAGALQTLIHQGTGQMYFQGWHNQLENEFIFNPYYQWTGRGYIFKTAPVSMDFVGTLDVALGNADTHFGTYGVFRLGHNLDNDFGVQRMNLQNDAPPVHSDKFSIYIFGGGGARVVLHNIFVQGNSPQSDLGYDLTLLRYEVTAGLIMAYKGYRAFYTWTYYTKDYETQIYKDHATASIGLEFTF